jgi:DNA polymerase-3 subunit gamma/tau
VPTTVQVGVTDTVAKTDLSVGDCVLATGQKDAKGVVAARSVNVVPAGPSGCFTGTGPGAGGGFGRGFGGGGFGGGGGGAPGGPPAGA